jgi:hypothetical protein
MEHWPFFYCACFLDLFGFGLDQKRLTVIDIFKKRASFQPSWVRKLTGKPVALTIADCESDARRI